MADNLRVKEVWVEGRRYILCHNPQEAARDAAERVEVVEALPMTPSGKTKKNVLREEIAGKLRAEGAI